MWKKYLLILFISALLMDYFRIIARPFEFAQKNHCVVRMLFPFKSGGYAPLADGRPGVFTVTGQIDPNTNKGYNWATVHNGNTYAGLGGDMVDIKSLLTRAEYRDLALAILNNKSLMVETIVRVTGCWLLQHGKLPGVSEEIKKFLDYDTSQAPNGFNFDVVDGKVVVKPL